MMAQSLTYTLVTVYSGRNLYHCFLFQRITLDKTLSVTEQSWSVENYRSALPMVGFLSIVCLADTCCSIIIASALSMYVVRRRKYFG